jgi:Fe-S oxidoreductase
MAGPLDPAILPAMVRCAGCHDQCLAATAEAVAGADQSLVVSRVATLGIRLLDGRMPWAPDTAAPLFATLLDGSQAEVCLFRSDGHRIEPWVRAMRAEAIGRGLAPAHVDTAAAAWRASGNVFGAAVPPSAPSGPGGTLLLHDAATLVHDPGAVPAALRLLERAGHAPAEAWIPSCGAPEADLGLSAEADDARARLVEAVAIAAPARIVSTDPTLVAAARAAFATRLPGIPVLHLAEALRDADPGYRERPVRLTVHDPGALARDLGAAPAVRAALRRVPGLTVLEPVTTGRLAAGDGSLGPAADEVLADSVARRRVEELERTGADAIVTSSPYSLGNLRRVTSALPIHSLATFLDAALTA